MPTPKKEQRPPIHKLEEGLQLTIERIRQRAAKRSEKYRDSLEAEDYDGALKLAEETIENEPANIEAIEIKIIALTGLQKIGEFKRCVLENVELIQHDFEALYFTMHYTIYFLLKHEEFYILTEDKKFMDIFLHFLDIVLKEEDSPEQNKAFLYFQKSYFTPNGSFSRKKKIRVMLESIREAYRLDNKEDPTLNFLILDQYVSCLYVYFTTFREFAPETFSIAKGIRKETKASREEKILGEAIVITAYELLCRIFIKDKRITEAKKCFRDLFRFSDRIFSDFWDGIVDATVTDGGFWEEFPAEERISFCDAAIAATFPYKEILFTKARALEKIRRYDEALEVYLDATKSQPVLKSAEKEIVEELDDDINNGIKRCRAALRKK
ncbi:MAG TPA: hypothetical protein VJB90_01040 [Candidatus Nanoarchaeia archaeon]|uniref:Tetratricopeptide repeat protein n=1 Tax=Candidatus Naiadarchaeum limnaeum TaxID=2756139 RepID=A0A832URY2_9ARCH|nr:hypothetical protein [Candidatus Naiadarchaeales archaeon SRR2090153.bin1042]HIK00467.1 hypothetical protein [Candidatus Naiadarchaeum limnaeum]HLD18577.1 hypothetical protein [Candidatus Nanoarchaeia archaeon]